MAENIEGLQISSILPSNLSEQPASDPESSDSDSQRDIEDDNEAEDISNEFQEPSIYGQHQAIHVQRSEIPTIEPTIIPHTYASFHLTSRQDEVDNDSSAFDFQPGEKPMPQKIRARSTKALKKLLKPPPKEDESPSSGLCTKCFKEKSKSDEEEALDDTALTPELQKASSEGLNMIKNIAFPSIPALLQDLWVYLELAISILAFSLGIRGTFPVESNEVFQYTYFALTVVSMVLALIDGYIYFVEVGSCARAFRVLKKKFKHEDEEEDDDEHLQKKTCCKPETKEKINTFFELGRNVLTELLLYPLIIFDLFSFEVEQTYQPDDVFDRVDYSLFIVGSFYLVLAVYIMRLLVLFSSVLSLLRVPKDNNKNSSGSLLLNFCLHSCGQIVVHLMIILVIGAKINTENRIVTDEITNTTNMSILTNNTNSTNDDDSDPIIRASPFLWVSIVLGWLLPLTGTAAFFIVNYYWMKEFSIEFWINMISLLQGASFAETVFGGDGLSETKDKTLEFVENTDYKKVKKQIEKFKSPGWFTKFFYPAKIPVIAISGVLYDICLIVFILSLMFTYENNHIQLVILKDDELYTTIFFVAVIIILIANLHILILLNSLLLILLLVIFISVSVTIFIILPILLFVYFPILGLLGYALLLKQLCNTKKTNKNPTTDKVNLNDHEMKEYI